MINPSTSGSLHLTLENGAKVRGFAVTPDGDVLFMDAQGVMRQMHPLVVEAMATQHVPSGIFAVAVMKKKSVDANIKQLGKTSLGLVDK